MASVVIREASFMERESELLEPAEVKRWSGIAGLALYKKQAKKKGSGLLRPARLHGQVPRGLKGVRILQSFSCPSSEKYFS